MTTATKTKIQIRSIFGDLLFEHECATVKECVEKAVADRASLVGASLVGARLDGARLDRARLDGARLDGASLVGASLDGASLDGARLVGARLDRARLDPIKADLIAEILKLPNELENLRDALAAGKVDGSTYSGECSCLAGTIAKNRGIESIGGGCEIKENGVAFRVDSRSPREKWFLGIRKGDKPGTNQVCKLAHEWVCEAIVMRDHIRESFTTASTVAS